MLPYPLSPHSNRRIMGPIICVCGESAGKGGCGKPGCTGVAGEALIGTMLPRVIGQALFSCQLDYCHLLLS